MNPQLKDQLPEIRRACTQLGVRRLGLFGSAVRGDFSPSSDVDVLVEFSPHPARTPFEQYFELKERLEEIVGRPVDLVTKDSMRNPYSRLAVERSHILVHGEAQPCGSACP